jgi:Tol biopolymer transport system component
MSTRLGLRTVGLAVLIVSTVAASPLASGAAARSRVLFTSGRSIVAISPRGHHERVLYHARYPARVSTPSESKSGRRIAFLYSVIANHGGPGPPVIIDKLYVAHRDGSHLRRVRKFRNRDVQSLQISPNGRRLLFSAQPSEASSTQHVYTVKVRGGGLRRVTHSDAAGTDPEFSPSGKRVIYTKNGPSGHNGIAKVKLSGGSGHMIFHSNSASEPSYSPDGRRIAFVNAGHSNLYHAWVMRSSGHRAHALIHNASQQFSPDFSPSGRSLVFAQERLPVVSWTLQTVHRNGSHRRVFQHGGIDPAWVR